MFTGKKGKEELARLKKELGEFKKKQSEEGKAQVEKEVKKLNKETTWCFFLKEDCHKNCNFYVPAEVSRSYFGDYYIANRQRCLNPQGKEKQ